MNTVGNDVMLDNRLDRTEQKLDKMEVIRNTASWEQLMATASATLVEGVTGPEDWFGCKFKYVENAWAEVEGWEDPRLRNGE